MQTPVAFTLSRIAADRWGRETLRRVLRAAWLGGCIFCIGAGLALLRGTTVPTDLLLAAALLPLVFGLVRSLRPALPADEVARRLDRRFGLREQLATALEVERDSGTDSRVALRLTELAEATVGGVRSTIRRREQFPWSDVIAATALLLVGIGMYLLTLPPQPIYTGANSIPALTGAPDANSLPPVPPEQDPNVPGPGPGIGVADPRVTGPIADALRDQGATRQAAEALDRGDTAAAAQQLRALADQAGQLSQASREDLARRLQQASRQVDPRDPAAAQQLRRSAEDIQRGGQNAAQGLAGLASALENLARGQPGQPGQPGGNAKGAQAGGQAGQGGQGGGTQPSNNGATEQRQGTHDRLNVEGQAVQLDAQGGGNQGKGQAGQQPTSSAGMGGVRGGQTSSTGPTGSDPLRVPLEDRDVVQDYFSK